MESGYIKIILQEIKSAIDELQTEGFSVTYPKQVEIERDGIKIIVPWL